MKRTMKRFAGMFLALAMMLSLSATAFAATNNTVPVSIKMYGEEAYTANVTTADIASRCKDGAEHLYDIPSNVTGQLAEYTAADALIAAYMMTYGNSFTDDQLKWHWDETTTPVEFAGWGLYFDTYDGLSSDDGNYYYVGTRVNDKGETVYHYYWEGDTWNFYINGSNEPTDWTSAHYAFADLTSIQFEYNTTRTEFDSETYFPANPAPSGN